MPLCFQDANTLTLPGSKSIINRLLMLALYHNLELHLENINLCDDVKEMHTVIQSLGSSHINITASGTALRFILPYLAFCFQGKTVVTIGERLSQRPIAPLVDCLVNAGADIKMQGNTIEVISKHASNLIFNIDTSQSSQFLSSLLLFRSAFPDTIINLTNSGGSLGYIRMTEEAISLLPLPHTRTLRVLLDPCYSTACYVWLYSFLMDKEVFIPAMRGIFQPDYSFIGVIERVKNAEELAIDMSNMPDQIITLAFLCLVTGVSAFITGCETLANKESNRIAGIIENVKRLGGYAEYASDTLYIKPLKDKPKECLLHTYNDHRFACTFWVLQQKYGYLQIDNLHCISKSVGVAFEDLFNNCRQ